MKKLVVLLLCLSMIFATVGCGNDAAESAGDKPITLKLATQHPTEHMAQVSAEAIKAKIEAETEGRVKIEIYPASQLGDYLQVYEEVMRGTIDLAHISTPEKYDPRVTIGFLPYLAKDYDELKKVFAADSFLTKEMTKIEAESHIKFLGYYAEGFSGIGVVDAVNEPSMPNVDKGSLVRVPSINAFKFPAERLGFSTSTIAYSDTFAAMQTGVVDGWVGGPPNLNYLTFRDVIKHYYQYNLTHESTQYLMNLEKFEGLTPVDQKIIEDAFREQCDASFEIAEQEDRKYLDLLKNQGIEVVEFTADELDAIAKDVRANVWPQLTDKYPQELMDGIVESLK